MKTGSHCWKGLDVKQESHLLVTFLHCPPFRCSGERTQHGWGLLNNCQLLQHAPSRCICHHLWERTQSSSGVWQLPQPSMAMLLTLRRSKMIRTTGNPNPTDPAHSLFSKLPKVTPKLTPPIMPLGQWAGQNSERTFNAWTSNVLFCFSKQCWARFK